MVNYILTLSLYKSTTHLKNHLHFCYETSFDNIYN